MDKLLLLWLIIGNVVRLYADCTFVFVNKTAHPLTVQGYFYNRGDNINDEAWISIPPTQKIFQVRSGSANCKSVIKHTSEISARINLKNGSGDWHANAGFLGIFGDKIYSSTTHNKQAFADNGSPVTLSSNMRFTKKEYPVFICAADINPDQCK